MTRAELNALKDKASVQIVKASDLDLIVAEILKLPYGQAKKVLTEPVLEVLRKYGYMED